MRAGLPLESVRVRMPTAHLDCFFRGSECRLQYMGVGNVSF
jgi:hypothetical protein